MSSEHSTAWVWLVELTGYTDASTSAVYRFATRDYTTDRADTPADTHYAGRVLAISPVERRMFANGQSGARANPRSEVGVGAIELMNTDGELDALFGDGTVSFRERSARVLRLRPGAAYSTAELKLVANISQAALQRDKVVVSIKDPSYQLASAHTTTTYAGNNALPAGVEGVADLAGKVKPLLYGKCFCVPAPCVNTSRLIFQVSNRALQSVQGVYDGGVALTAGATYSSQVDMETTAPSAGQYRAWLAGGMVRLGSSPVYRITVDATGDTAGNSTAAQLLKTLALERGISSGDINAADVTALDTANSAVLGIWISDSQSTLDAMDAIARSVGAYHGFDRLGVLRMQRFGLPSAASGLGLLPVLASWDGVTLESLPAGEDVPTTTVRLKYARYWQTQAPGELSSSATDAQVSDLGQAWRVSSYTGSISPNPHKRTLTAERETLFTTKADADAEAARLYALTNAPRRTHLVSGAPMGNPALDGLDINDEAELRWNRFGLGAVTGTTRLVIAMTENLIEQRADVTLWGA